MPVNLTPTWKRRRRRRNPALPGFTTPIIPPDAAHLIETIEGDHMWYLRAGRGSWNPENGSLRSGPRMLTTFDPAEVIDEWSR